MWGMSASPLVTDGLVEAGLVHKAGGSLRDVQILAGHRSIQTTQAYIDGDTDVQRRLVALI
jgi:integrase/recombinase XerD